VAGTETVSGTVRNYILAIKPAKLKTSRNYANV